MFAPKYRRKAFYEARRLEVGQMLRQLCDWKGVNIIEAEVCPDHIHMLLEIPPKMSVSGFVGYIVLGHYIKVHINWSVKKTLAICIPVLLACYAFGVWQFHHRCPIVDTPAELEMHWQNDTIIAGLMSACVFLLFKCIKSPGKAYGAVKKVSGASYGMYLMHMLMLPAIFSLLDKYVAVPVAIICTALLTYLFSYIISNLIGKLPFGKYIVG